MPASRSDAPELVLTELTDGARENAVPVIVDSFTGIYRWHAKRTLRSVSRVRGAWRSGELVGVSMLELLDPAVGYVYYLAVLRSHRRSGVARRLLDDALDLFRKCRGPSRLRRGGRGQLRLFAAVRERGFRPTAPKERSWREGGLGAWGFRSRMMVVSGELLLGLRLSPEPDASAGPPGV